MKRYNFFIALISALFIVNAAFASGAYFPHTFGNLTNYGSYVNVTVNNWNSTLPFNAVNLNIGKQGYVYVNTSFNASLASTPIGYLTIEGYQGDVWVGNVTAYPYPLGHGLLIKNTTVYGYPYNSLTLWFNERTPNKTYLDAYNLVSGSNLAIQHSTIGTDPVSLFIYNTSGINGIIRTNKQALPYTLNLKGQDLTYFNLTSGAILIAFNQTPSYIVNNLTLSMVASNWGYSYALVISNTLQTLSTTGLFTAGVTSQITGINTYIHGSQSCGVGVTPCPSYLISNGVNIQSGLGIFSNGSVSYTPNPFNDAPLINGRQFGLAINYTNSSAYAAGIYHISPESIPPQTYFLIPSYTTNYTHAVYTVVNPTPLNTTNDIDTVAGWYYDFNYREKITVNDWNFTFPTHAYISAPNYFTAVNYTYKITAGYLLLTVPKVWYMGTSCNSVYFNADGSNTLLSKTIPFGIVNCTGVNATFILRNTTQIGGTYNNFYMFSGSRSITLGGGFPTPFSTPSLVTAWKHTYNGANMVTFNNIPYNYAPSLITLDVPLIAPNFISDNNGIVTLTGTASRTKLLGNSYVTSIPETRFLSIQFPPVASPYYLQFAGDNVFTWALSCGTACSIETNNLTTYHTTGTTGLYGVNLLLNFSSLYHVHIYKLWTSNRSIGALEGYPTPPASNASSGSCEPNLCINNSSGTPLNNSVVAGMNQSVWNSKKILSNMGLMTTLNFYGFSLPSYYIAIMVILLVLFALAMFGENELGEAPIILVLIIAWLVGVFTIAELPLAFIITLIYAVHAYIEHNKKV